MKLPSLHRTDLIEVNCPVCNQNRKNFLYDENKFSVWSCMNCTHIYVSPQPSDSFYKSYYNNWDYD